MSSIYNFFFRPLTNCLYFIIRQLLIKLQSIMDLEPAEEKQSNPEVPFSFKCMKIEIVKALKNSSAIPKSRSGHRIVCTESYLYSFGGYNPSTTMIQLDDLYQYSLFKELWRYNFITRKWEMLKTGEVIPSEVASSAVWLEGQTMMIYGGTGLPFGFRCSNHLYICNVNDYKGLTEIRTKGSNPLPQYGQAILCEGPYLYTVGGTTGFLYTCDIHRLDMRTGVWEDIFISKGDSPSQEPSGRYRHELAFDGGKIFILGGGTSDITYSFQNIDAFNLETRQWEFNKCKPDLSLSPENAFPHSRRCHGSVQIKINNGVQVFISGGYDGVNEFNDIWRLDLSTLQWTLLRTELPSELFFHCAAVTPDNCMYIFGGIEDMERTNKIYKMWLDVPKLSVMCWEALLHYSPNLYKLHKEKLLGVGIPSKYVNRI